MLETTLTARIKLKLDLSKDLWPVIVDTGELEDSILNICINAMHAMESGGYLTIQTENFIVQEKNIELLELRPGDYVLLSIIDTGCGMSDEVIEKIFDPFYTTKGDKGTGLGLSQVYGFMESSGGAIKVYSEANHGTRFLLYFPRFKDADVEYEIKNKEPDIKLEGDETILVVDGEKDLLNLCVNILERQGYHVLKAASAMQALNILETASADLMLSDIIMPEMDGVELATTVQSKYPAMKIILTSGFSDNRQQNLKDKSLYKNLIHKPYQPQVLLKKIRELLNA
jgi:CheY-like chemotaxis protein